MLSIESNDQLDISIVTIDQSELSIYLPLAALEPAVLEPAALHRQLVQLLAHSLQVILIISRKTILYAFAEII